MFKGYNNEYNREMITLSPGDYFATGEDKILATLLGSCVSACLYDPVNRIIGMNHFMLVSRLENPEKFYLQKSGRYALNAMELLINEMMKKGAKKNNLKAKAFGGAVTMPSLQSEDIPRSNVEFIKSFLKVENIELTSYNFGGSRGRKIFFFNDGEFSVLQRRLGRMDEVHVVQEDREYLIHERERIAEDKSQ